MNNHGYGTTHHQHPPRAPANNTQACGYVSNMFREWSTQVRSVSRLLGGFSSLTQTHGIPFVTSLDPAIGPPLRSRVSLRWLRSPGELLAGGPENGVAPLPPDAKLMAHLIEDPPNLSKIMGKRRNIMVHSLV